MEDRIIRKNKIKKFIEELKATVNKFNLFDIHRIPHPTTSGYIFFTSAHKTFLKIEFMLDYKPSLNIHNIFYDQSRIELEINNKKITRNSFLIVWKLSNTILNNIQSKKKS